MSSMRTLYTPSTVQAIALSLLFLCVSAAAGQDTPPLPTATAIADCPTAGLQPTLNAPMCRVAVPAMTAGWKAAALRSNGSLTPVKLTPRSGLQEGVVFSDSLSSVEALVVYRGSASGRTRGGNSLRLVKRSGNVELVY